VTRVSLPIDEELREEIRERPDAFGFAPGLSEAQRCGALLAEGARARLAAHRGRKRHAR